MDRIFSPHKVAYSPERSKSSSHPIFRSINILVNDPLKVATLLCHFYLVFYRDIIVTVCENQLCSSRSRNWKKHIIYIHTHTHTRRSTFLFYFLLKGLLVFCEWRRNHGNSREGATTLYRKSHLSDVSFFLSGINYGEDSSISIIIITATIERLNHHTSRHLDSFQQFLTNIR
ncbi:hypothetical protein HAX54_038569 [Datura stramonium]|uniref:Uncharacterized protein n=1 Tax=Datura stramonium TaxID=4076 RepID=A0ABS8SI88_DATST|nr:hypothetical protein [Datura stramonium]